ncbi:glycosyltransferase family 2 protein [Chloroflexota bacterium]
MFHRIKVVDIELNCPLTTIENLDGYVALKGLVRLHGTPLGYIQLPVIGGCCLDTAIGQVVLEQYSEAIINHLISDGLAASQSGSLRIEDLVNAPHPVYNGPLPLVTVAVCTRNRTADLALCLDSLLKLNYPALDLLVVDNAPSDEATEQLVRERFSTVRYVCEPRPGLDWARNRAIIEARGEIIAYTDDDVVVDSGWVSALVKVFTGDPEVMAVTGLVIPHELETESQILFEKYGGFGRGFKQIRTRLDAKQRDRWRYYGAGQYGTGANMAYRRSVFGQIGLFDPALDVGTVTNGGGDLEMFFRVLKEGHILVYEPEAVIRHRHRREYAKLHTQITNNGIGLYSYFVRSALAYPDERLNFTRLGLWWLWWWYIRRLLISFFSIYPIPRELIWTELWGVLVGLTRYQKARQTVVEITAGYGPQPDVELPAAQTLSPPLPPKHPYATAVRHVDVNQPLSDLTDVGEYNYVRIFVTKYDQPLGSFDIAHYGSSITAARLQKTIVDYFGLKLLTRASNLSEALAWNQLIDTLTRHYIPKKTKKALPASITKLPPEIPVSVVVATLDRPEDLRDCLQHLTAQQTSRDVEIIVVDNNPSSGLTLPVVAEFPQVVLVNETRRGLSYARNAGIVASKGDIVIATDDDVTVPPHWLENLVAPFVRPDVMIVTGNVLPLELENTAQHLFERYGGLGRGFESFEVNKEWFESFGRWAVPTWELGATANAAFRATIFHHPQIGLLDEALGVGTPTGCSEDTYLFYKVIKADYTLMYEPSAYAWHKHRRTMAALRRQLFSYSKGHVAYHLTTFMRDNDVRGLWRVILELPKWHLQQFLMYGQDLVTGDLFRGKGRYPLRLILVEIWGNLVGPWALWQSRRSVKREGHSKPYVPVDQRSEIIDATTSNSLQNVSEAYHPSLQGVSTN